MPTFLVVCKGRSGSKWLARELNRSPSWRVKHEGDGQFKHRHRYGEVNGYLRYVAKKVPVDRLGVIVRDPLKIARSAFYRTPHFWNRFIHILKPDLVILDELLEMPSTVMIKFSHMVTNPVYLTRVAAKLGIDDLFEDAVDRSRCNSSPAGELTKNQVLQVQRHSQWFIDKWL